MNTQVIANLAKTIGQIKNLRRRGWVLRHVSDPESDADHMYSMALQILLLTPPHLDRFHCLKLALTHNLPEIYATDYVPGEISETAKREQTFTAAQKLAMELDFPELYDLVVEFENQSSPVVKCLDKTDNIFTAAYYEQQNRTPDKLLAEFAPHALKEIAKIDTPARADCEEIIHQLCKGF